MRMCIVYNRIRRRVERNARIYIEINRRTSAEFFDNKTVGRIVIVFFF